MKKTKNISQPTLHLNFPEETYSINILSGNSPFDLRLRPNISSPVISREQLSDPDINFAADPFLIKVKGKWYLFYEVMPIHSRLGIINCSSSQDLKNWTHHGTILREDFHLSYPQVFESEQRIFMIPETYQNGKVTLYEAQNFPYDWRPLKDLIHITAVDTTYFDHNGYSWLFLCDRPQNHDRLRLFHASHLMGNWTEHNKSPIFTNDKSRSRPAGKLFRWNEKLFRSTQDCSEYYGASVNLFEITRLTIDDYHEVAYSANPILSGSGYGWNKKSMHHLDVHQLDDNKWIAAVDGRRN